MRLDRLIEFGIVEDIDPKTHEATYADPQDGPAFRFDPDSEANRETLKRLLRSDLRDVDARLEEFHLECETLRARVVPQLGIDVHPRDGCSALDVHDAIEHLDREFNKSEQATSSAIASSTACISTG